MNTTVEMPTTTKTVHKNWSRVARKPAPVLQAIVPTTGKGSFAKFQPRVRTQLGDYLDIFGVPRVG